MNTYSAIQACEKCKKIIKSGESAISMMKNLRKIYYHARCFGAEQLEKEEKEKVAHDSPGSKNSNTIT